MTVHTGVAEAVAAWLARQLGTDHVELRDFVRHAEGWSWETYTWSAVWSGKDGRSHQQGFALRREPDDGLLPPYSAAAQYRLHRAVRYNSEVPLPDLYWLEEDSSVLGQPFYVMARVDGVVPVPWRGNHSGVFPTAEARRRLGREFVDVLALIHTLDWQGAGLSFLGAPDSSDAAARREIDRWESFYEESLLLEEPLMREAFAWLRGHIATSNRLSLVHADYRLGNFMVRDGRIVAVLDWELAHIGDPIFDVANSGLRLYRGRSPLFSQLIAADEYFARYEDRTGLAVDADVFRFWTVFAHVRAVAPHLRACRAFEEGRASDLRLAAMGHQALYILKHLAEELGLTGSA